MYCFWSGELNIGAIDGVVATEPGFMHGREVVQVTYNPAAVKYEDILQKAKQAKCADAAFVHNEEQARKAEKVLGENKVRDKSNFRLDRDRKYYLSKTHYRAVPMTSLQAIHANRLIANGKSPDTVLSDKQIAFAKQMEKQEKAKWINRVGEDFVSAWETLE